MNLYKLYACVGILLALCTYESEAGLVLLLLIKIIMLKGAIFFGLPLALGSFLLGQGAGFFKGSLFGGYTALSAAYKFQQKHVVKHKPYIVIRHGPTKGWGWTRPPAHGWGWESAPVTSYAHVTQHHGKGWGWTPKPSFLKRLTTIPSYWANKIMDIKRKNQQGWGWEADHHDHPDHHDHHDHHLHHHDSSHATHAFAGHGHGEDGHHYVSSDATVENGADYHSSSGADYGGYSSSPDDTGGASHQSSAQTGGYENDKTFTNLMKAVELAQQQYAGSHEGNHAGESYTTHSAPHHSDADYSNLEQLAYESRINPGATLPAPNPLLENFLEKKLREEIQNQKSESRRKEASQLIQMLRETYVQELVDSLNPQGRNVRRSDATTPLSDFIPFPTDVPNSTTAKPAVKLMLHPATDEGSTTPKPPTSTISSVQSVPTPPIIVQSQRAEPIFKVRRRKRPGHRVQIQNQVLTKRTAELDPSSFRGKRQSTAGQLPNIDLQALNGFTEDVKKFFLLVSLLDSDKCLQKLVCEVHTKPPSATLSTYESNIVVTFKVMSVLLPSNVEDATKNYRKAAKIGELSKNAEICGKAYPTCTHSTDEIIKMGNQVAATEALPAGSPLVTLSPAVADAAGDLDAEGSEVQGQTMPMTTTPASVMPQI